MVKRELSLFLPCCQFNFKNTMLGIKKIRFYNIILLFKYLTIRYKVFVTDDQRPLFGEFGFQDLKANHYVLMLDNKVIGSARIIFRSNEAELGRFALLHNYRGYKYGKRFLQLMLKTQSQNSVEKIHIIVEKKLIEFYNRIGFVLFGNIEINGYTYHRMYFYLNQS